MSLQRALAPLLLAAVALACAAPLARVETTPPEPVEVGPPAPTTESGRLLRQAMDEVWQRTLDESIYLRLQFGLPIDQLPDLTRRHARETVTHARDLLARLEAVDPAELTHQETLSLLALRFELESTASSPACFWLGFPVTTYSSPLPLAHRAFAEHPLADAADAEHYLALLADYPRLLRQIERHLELQVERGILMPRAAIDVSLPALQAAIQPPTKGPFAVGERAAALPDGGAALRAGIAAVVKGRINPRLRRLVAFLDGPYREQAPEAVGLAQYPGGRQCYRQLIRYHTTLDLTPREIHNLGKREVRRLEQALLEVRRDRVKWNKNKAQFHAYLRTNQRFVPRDAAAIGAALEAAVEAVVPRIGWRFSTVPQASYAVERLDPALEGAMTYGYYRPPTDLDPRGVYFYNGSQPEKRSILWARSLIYHELLPGHHFQVALQQENTALHPLRRNSFNAFFVEGWAEYASDLGHELKVYERPYDLYGRLAAEMFLTCRLVVDTGMNALGWTRQQAIDYMLEHSLESDVQIGTETLRYAVDMPGQALAYRTGAIEIARLRARAEDALGDAFDIRAFHTAMLDSGALPMVALEHHIGHFIRQHQAPPDSADDTM